MTPLETVAVDPFTGSIHDAIPLPLPRLPDSFQIQSLATLAYSQSLADGPLGVGWNLEVGHVAPSFGSIGSPTVQRMDVSYPGGGGQVVLVSPGVWMPRI
jgi:hypothetical protein